jgi:hypothetical protein
VEALRIEPDANGPPRNSLHHGGQRDRERGEHDAGQERAKVHPPRLTPHHAELGAVVDQLLKA